MNPEARPFYPHDPAPGIYAISVTNLQGVHFANHDQFAWFRDREPLANVGHSMLIYEVPERGRPADLLLSGVQLDELEAADFALLETNAVTPHWLDTTQSWLSPEGDNIWLALGSEQTIHPALADGLNLEAAVSGSDYTLYRVGAAVERPPDDPPLAIFLGQEGGQIDLLRYTISSDSGADGDAGKTILLLTAWRQSAAPLPVKIFVHLLRPDGSIASQYDGLGVAWEGWRSGDVLWQLHSLPADLPSGEYTLTAGLYDPQTLKRWTADGRDAMTLSQIRLPVASEKE